LPKKHVPTLAGRTIRCILFDCGETLWTRKEKAIWHSLESIANQRALTLLREHVSPGTLPIADEVTLGYRLRQAVEEQIRERKHQDPEREPDFIALTQQGLAQLGIVGLDSDVNEALFEALRLRIPESRPLFHDTLSTLAALQQRGFLLGIVTNRQYGGKLFLEDLEMLGLLDYFQEDHIAVSADLGVRKPHSDLFLHALNALRVPPQEAAMVGDSLSADIAGAKRLGIFAIWKPKPRLIARARATSLDFMTRPPEEIEPPAELDRDDDDALLAYAYSREKAWKYQSPSPESKPDLIIEHLSDLLNVFAEAGPQ
jgi:HAD superfamily hydrolase (TIGR01549 family)